jgi:hypothetical protein
VTLLRPRVLSDHAEAALAQPDGRAEQEPKPWPEHTEDQCEAHQADEESLMVDIEPVAHQPNMGRSSYKFDVDSELRK